MAIALVTGQVAQSTFAGASATTQTLALPVAPTAGNLVVCGLILRNSDTATCKDGNNNSFTATPKSNTFANGGGIWIFYLKNAPSNASASITCTATISQRFNMFLAEFSGADKSAPFESDIAHTAATSQTNVNDPTITTNIDGDLLFNVCFVANTISAVNSPWSVVSAINGDGNAASYDIQTSHGSQAINYTENVAGTWTSLLAAFRPAGFYQGLQPLRPPMLRRLTGRKPFDPRRVLLQRRRVFFQGSAPPTVTLTLDDINNVALPNASPIHWMWWDSVDPAATKLAPVAAGTASGTDPSGKVIFTLSGSVLTHGQLGTLMAYFADGSRSGAYIRVPVD